MTKDEFPYLKKGWPSVYGVAILCVLLTFALSFSPLSFFLPFSLLLLLSWTMISRKTGKEVIYFHSTSGKKMDKKIFFIIIITTTAWMAS